MRAATKQEMRVMISIGDYHDTEQFLKATIGMVERDVVEALLRSAIICYARPYSANERDAGAAAESNLKGVIDPQDVLTEPVLLDLHKQIIRLRNKVVAHSEAEFNPANFADRTSHGRDPNIPGVCFETSRWHALGEKIDVGHFEQMARKMRWACLARLDPRVNDSRSVVTRSSA
jgi:hypothetical protein